MDAAITSFHPATWFPLVSKVQRGQPIVVACFGSSVCENFYEQFFSGEGVLRANGQKCRTHAARLCPGANHTWPFELELHAAVPCHTPGVLADFLAHVNATWPHAGHALHNFGRSAATLRWFVDAPCIDAYLPVASGVNLLVFEQYDEVTAGAWAGREPGALVEKLYHQMSAKIGVGGRSGVATPLVVVSHPRVHANGDVVRSTRRDTACGGEPFAHRLAPNAFVWAAEDGLSAHAAYYGWATVSVRNAMWEGMSARLGARNNLTDCEYLSVWLADNLHPSPQGARFLAAVFRELLGRSVASRAASRASGLPAPRRRLPAAPLSPGAWAPAPASRCYAAMHLVPAGATPGDAGRRRRRRRRRRVALRRVRGHAGPGAPDRAAPAGVQGWLVGHQCGRGRHRGGVNSLRQRVPAPAWGERTAEDRLPDLI